MGGEFSTSDVPEIKKPQVENFKEIKPETGMSSSDAKSFWTEQFINETGEVELGGKYNSYEDRLKHTMLENSDYGEYEGERGESKFVPSEITEDGKACKEKLDEYGLDGIEYKNAEPDFSKCSEATVEIDNMTENRYDYIDSKGDIQAGNFSQADVKCAEKWNNEAKNGKTDWTPSDVADYRHENKLTWHERCDTKTMDLVPREVHGYIKHLGGVSECKVRDAINNAAGGGFDE